MMNNDDLKYKDVIRTLKSLPKVNAPGDFETLLQRRINSQSVEKEKSFRERFFIPSRLIPSAALAVSAVVLFFILTGNNKTENPLLTEPKVREDIVSLDNKPVVSAQNEPDSEEIDLGEKTGIPELRKEISDSGVRSYNYTLPHSISGYSIDKEGLNFRQVVLTREEQNQIKSLKEKLEKVKETVKN